MTLYCIITDKNLYIDESQADYSASIYKSSDVSRSNLIPAIQLSE